MATNYFLLPASTGKKAILWALALFACSQVALTLYLNRQKPEVRDPAFGLRILSLKARLAEKPGAPLVLVLGSSRVLNGFSPADMRVHLKQTGSEPLIYNFAFSGSGSVRELMTFRRLRAEGIKSEWMLIETWPVLWPEDGTFAERRIIEQDDLRWIDTPVYLRYMPGKIELLSKSIKGNLLPLLSYRSRLLHATARVFLPHQQVTQFDGEYQDWDPFDGTGWLPCHKHPETPEELWEEVVKGRWYTYPLVNPLRVSANSDKALHDLLDECRAAGIKIALLLMPEHSECRRWYSPQAQNLVSSYLSGICKEYGISAFDTRDWSPDGDFADFCHMVRHGAKPFSERFAREVMQPWLNGEALSHDVLLKEPSQTVFP
jgi:hypothetical protein